nr:MAG TPA: hypothetical protein [Caudoviricetes sp.]
MSKFCPWFLSACLSCVLISSNGMYSFLLGSPVIIGNGLLFFESIKI